MGRGARGTPVSISKRDKTIVADIDLEKRFYSSPDGVRLNVSAGLPVPEGRLDKANEKTVLNRHGHIVP